MEPYVSGPCKPPRLSLDQPKLLQEKQAKAAKIFGTDSPEAQRPDIPLVSRPTLFEGAPLTDELDRWKLLLHDPRFAGLKGAWQSKQLDDVTALKALQNQIEGREMFSALNSSYGPGRIDKKGAELAFGVGSHDTINPLLAEPKSAIARMAEERHWTGEQVDQCLAEIADFWRSYYAAESQLLKTNGAPKFTELQEGFVSSQKTRYQEAQNRCLGGT